MQGEGSWNSEEQYRFCYLERPRIIICRFNKFKDKKNFQQFKRQSHSYLRRFFKRYHGFTKNSLGESTKVFSTSLLIFSNCSCGSQPFFWIFYTWSHNLCLILETTLFLSKKHAISVYIISNLADFDSSMSLYKYYFV